MASPPNLFALPVGVDFASELIRGIDARLGPDPCALARAEIWVNTERTRRRLFDLYHQGPARLLPNIRLVTGLRPLIDTLASPLDQTPLPDAVSPVRRRLDLLPLVTRYLEISGRAAGPAMALDLVESLALLLTEMADEDVAEQALQGIDVGDFSEHWQAALAFLTIAANAGLSPEEPGQQRQIADAIAAQWATHPPGTPVFLAGSTGSRGPVSVLMQALLRTPNGHVILPGFDFGMGQESWDALDSSVNPEDHPQFRFHRLLRRTGIDPSQVRPWTDAQPGAPDRNRLMSLALRPAPVTDGWMRAGPGLGDLRPICDSATLIEAESPRAEASAIAFALRAAVQTGKRAALITPDRRLARRVTAALDRWRITPDDSAGTPLSLTPQGRMLALLAASLAEGVTGETLVALLGNPITASGRDRKDHLNHARAFELFLRAEGIVSPGSATLNAWADGADGADGMDQRRPWAAWLGNVLDDIAADPAPGLSAMLGHHIHLAETLARGPSNDPDNRLWADETGQELQKLVDSIARAASDSDRLTPTTYARFLSRQMAGAQVREAILSHPGVMIWGTLEARVQTVDLAILAGLNEGTWPGAPDPDPWLSRDMRAQAGLLSPERRIGLAAHDFQTAAGAAQVIFSRAVRDEDAMQVPSRWLNRLTNLLAGLRDQGGQDALDAMRARGRHWLDMARALDHRVTWVSPAPRPSPAPPSKARPDRLSVTRIATLRRDPYAIYASQILRLKPLDPLRPEPDARIRGTRIHTIFERFLRQATASPGMLTPGVLAEIAQDVMADLEDWPVERALWTDMITSAAAPFVADELRRWQTAVPAYFEITGALGLTLEDGSPFTLAGQPDRIDIGPAGDAWIYDYKSGHVPTKKEQEHFDRQIYLLGIMAESAAFRDQTGPVPAVRVAGGGYLGVGRNLKTELADLASYPLASVRADLIRLLSAYRSPGVGYTARARMQRKDHAGDYDHLSRRGEWDESTAAIVTEVGQ